MAKYQEFKGHFEIVYSPDDGGYYADMWEDPDIDSPICPTAWEAKEWALKNGGMVEHY